jgi:A/G-specific adenine glycosylase
MAEMMVQRTRAAQAEATWIEFIRRFPTAESAAAADDAELTRVLAGLGLRWRIAKIVAAVRTLAMERGGAVPTAQDQIESLPGVGHYAASSVRTVAFGARVPVVDANVVRVYCRFFGLRLTDSLRRDLGFHRLAAAMAPRSQGTAFNWALLDLGATVCSPKRPKCAECPVAERCQTGVVARATTDASNA